MAKKNKEKATMKDVVSMIGKIIAKVDYMEVRLSTVDSLFAQYVEFNKDGKNFKKHLDKTLEKLNANRENLGKSPEGNREAKVRNIKDSGSTTTKRAKEGSNMKDK